jgi:hypothetical protein
MAKIRIVKNKEEPESTPVLADAILKISDALETLSKSDLNERAIIVLTIDACERIVLVNYGTKRKPSYKEIKAILDAMKQLKAWYLK